MEFQPPVVASFRFSPRWKKLVQVTAVFCQSAIDSAQSDHTMMVQSILDDKAAAIGPTDPYLGLFHGAYQENIFPAKGSWSAIFLPLNVTFVCEDAIVMLF